MPANCWKRTRASIGLVDEERDIVRTEAVYRMQEGELGSEFGRGDGMAGYVFETRRPIILERYGDLPKPVSLWMTDDAAVGIPIVWRDQMTGFFGVSSHPPRKFTAEDAATLSLFAKHAGIAVENARRFDKERRHAERLKLIARIGQIITANLQLGDLLQEAADAIHSLLGYPNVAIPLFEPGPPDVIVMRAVSGFCRTHLHGEYRLPVSMGIMGAAVREGRTQLVNDVSADPRYVPTPGATGIQAELAVPILLGERVLGVLNIESGGRFAPEDAESLQVVAGQLAVAIENARLFAETHRTLSETHLLYQASKRLAAALSESDAVSAYLGQLAAGSTYVCGVGTYEESAASKAASLLIRGYWVPDTGCVLENIRIPQTPSVLDAPLDAGETVTIRDVFHDPRVSAVLRRVQAKQGRPALAMVPLIARGERIGVVVLSHTCVHDWTAAELHPYQITAAQLATALDRSRQTRLLADRGRQVAVLKERERLGRELHDSVTQLLFSLNLIAQSVGPVWRLDPAAGERRIQRVWKLSQAALVEMRTFLAELRPNEARQGPLPVERSGLFQVRQEGLVSAMSAYAAEAAQDGLKIEMVCEGYLQQVFVHESCLYRIIQEALRNVVKHAQAHSAQVRLSIDRTLVHLLIRDDGIGFAAPSGDMWPLPGTMPGHKLGLVTMQERAEALAGNMRVLSMPGGGTTVEVALPRRDEPHDQVRKE